MPHGRGSRQRRNMANNKCGYCGVQGHYQSNCPDLNSSQALAASSSTNVSSSVGSCNDGRSSLTTAVSYC